MYHMVGGVGCSVANSVVLGIAGNSFYPKVSDQHQGTEAPSALYHTTSLPSANTVSVVPDVSGRQKGWSG
jgi:hypothetical protein